MKVDDATVFAITLNVTSRIHDSLDGPRMLSKDGTSMGFIIEGQLPLKAGSARCRFRLNPSWLEMPPIVTCTEPWVRTGAEWHVSEKSHAMCYIFGRQWLALIEQVARESDILSVIQIAHVWIIRNCQWLLNKHLLVDQLGLSAWDNSWGFWPHGNEAAGREYERRMKQGEINER